jgi:hypothetical protein
MAICSSGISAPKAGTTDDVYLTALVLAGIAQKFAPWLEPFIAYATAEVTLHLPDFCAVDPPADPGINAADILALLAVGPGPLTAAATVKVTQLLSRFAWFNFCRCVSVATPAPPAGPAAPVGLPSINPPAFINLPTSVACTTAIISPAISWNPPTGTFLNTNNYLHFNATSLRSTLQLTTTTAPGYGVTFVIQNLNDDQVILSTFGPFVVAAGGHDVQVVGVPLGTTHQRFLVTGQSGSGAITATLTLETFCNGQEPGGSSSPCCPPDLISSGLLTQILQTVNLIQRQIAPFGFVPGATHAGLTGSGELTVADLIGLELTITGSTPGVIGTVAGDPLTLFEAGWINWGSAAGFQLREFISSSPFLSFPAGAGAMTKIGYSLNAGVTATIVELAREP